MNKNKDKGKVLIIAYAFPPMAYAGVYRSIRFCKYLVKFGWQPSVLTIRNYSDLDNDSGLLKQIPEEVKIYRTFAVDPIRWLYNRNKSRKNTSKMTNNNKNDQPANEIAETQKMRLGVIKQLKKSIMRILDFPDHMNLWIPFAVFAGVKVMLKEKPDVIYTSSPPHSSQLVGLILSKLFGKPWVADFRDPWVDAYDFESQCYHSNGYQKVGKYLEKLVTLSAAKVLMISDVYRDKIRRRYPESGNGKFQTLSNGFDEDDMTDLEAGKSNHFTITYTGAFYAHRRPDAFLDGLKLWLDNNQREGVRKDVQVLFVGPESEEVSRSIGDRELNGIVKTVGFVPKKKALEMALGADLLLLVIGLSERSEGILTSKIFDYFLCRKPILAIVPQGEAERLVRKSRTGCVVTEDNPGLVADAIENAFRVFENKQEDCFQPDLDVIERYNGEKLTGDLAAIFDQVSKRAAS